KSNFKLAGKTRVPPRPDAATPAIKPAPEPLNWAFGRRKFGWFRALNDSKRNWKFFCSWRRKFFMIERLKYDRPGPSRMLRPELPYTNDLNPYLSMGQPT